MDLLLSLYSIIRAIKIDCNFKVANKLNRLVDVEINSIFFCNICDTRISLRDS